MSSTPGVPEPVPVREGRWAVVVGGLAVVATFAASLVFFQGFLGVAAVPGPMPPINHVPHTPATERPLALMRAGLWLYGLAGTLAAVGLVSGIHFFRRPDGFRHGTWAIALSACTPVLALMLLSGMGAT